MSNEDGVEGAERRKSFLSGVSSGTEEGADVSIIEILFLRKHRPLKQSQKHGLLKR